MDENDLLSTNEFIKKPELTGEVPPQFNDEFQKYYKNEMEKADELKLRQSLDRISIRSLQLDEETDSNSILNTNKFVSETNSLQNVEEVKRYKKEIKTYVSIDSRDRNKALFAKPNNFKIFLGKTFYNVKSIRLASIEFPNTNAVINSNNNRIYWRNQQDIDDNIIDDVTGTYPVYSVDLRIGSYIANTLQNEISNRLASVKRENKTGDFHYFVVTLDIDTDIVTLKSLTLTQLNVNPISVVIGSNIVLLTVPNHGYEIGSQTEIYVLGAKNLSGIPSATLNGEHTATAISTSTLSYEINVKASDTAIGGGNTVQLGIKSPFQLLFGENPNTVAQNIGFPLENSSVRISNYIKNIETFYQTQIVTKDPHNFLNTSDFIGQTCTIIGSSTTPNIDGTRLISKIINSTTFYIQTSSEVLGVITDNGQITFGASTFDIASISNVNINTVLVETFTNHNFDLTNVGRTVTFYNTISVPNFDGDNIINTVLSPTTFVINGSILGTELPSLTYPVSNIEEGGSFSQHHIISTKTLPITNVTPGVFTRFTSPNHGLEIGQQVQFYNLITSPSILSRNIGIYTVNSIPDVNNFTIDFETLSYDPLSITNNEAYIGLNVVTVSFPYHGFNNIVSITQPSYTYSINSIINYDRSGDSTNDSYRVTTTLPHYLQTDYSVVISGSDSVPSVNGTFTVLEVLSTTDFVISQVSNSSLTTPGTTGSVSPKLLEITTQLNHNFNNGDKVRVSNTNASVSGGFSVDNGGYVVSVVDADTFFIPFSYTLTSNGTSGIIGLNQEFFLYGVSNIGGIPDHVLNNTKYTVKDIIDEHTFTFIAQAFASSTEQGGNNIYISSLFHGFSGDQDNTKNSLLNRSINLEGENYAFLTCPQLGTMMNTGDVKNIFARITLDQSPGSMVFAYLSNPKEFTDVPLNQLSELEFSIVNYDNSLYDFNDLDYSFVLEITEIIDSTDVFNISSRRGVRY